MWGEEAEPFLARRSEGARWEKRLINESDGACVHLLFALALSTRAVDAVREVCDQALGLTTIAFSALRLRRLHTASNR